MASRSDQNVTDNLQEVSEAMEECHISKRQPQPDITLTDEVSPELLSKWPKYKSKPPALFLHRPVDIIHHMRRLHEILGFGNKCFVVLGPNFIKFDIKSFDISKTIVRYITEQGLPFHTFGHPDSRVMKVVVKDLPADTDLDKVKEHLLNAEIPVERINKMHTSENHNAHLILVVLSNISEGQKMLQVTHIMGHKVKLEPPRSKPRQCHRCQRWGHNQKYCHGKVKCVKCADNHWSNMCRKQPREPPNCANCGGAHTANYKKCPCCPESSEYKKSKKVKSSK